MISAVNNALQTAVEAAGKPDRPSTDSLPGQTHRDIASVLTGKSPSMSSHRNTYGSKAPARHATVGDRPGGYRREEKFGDEGKLLKQVRDADAGNKMCADCGTEIKVDWVSINLGIIICIECSGIHRSLGTHITKVRSLTLDVTSFTPDIIEILLKVGNRISNAIWEARLDPGLKPGPMSTREQRLHFITSKYADRASRTYSTRWHSERMPMRAIGHEAHTQYFSRLQPPTQHRLQRQHHLQALQAQPLAQAQHSLPAKPSPSLSYCCKTAQNYRCCLHPSRLGTRHEAILTSRQSNVRANVQHLWWEVSPHPT